MSDSIHYRPEIDGLRAVAILAVVLFHLRAPVLPGGFTGVDVFFVISGFLITSILIRQQGAGTLRLRDFWLRRARRLLPSLAFILALGTLAAFLTLFGPEFRNFGWQCASALTMSSNIYMYRSAGNYWGPEAEDFQLLHLWSLALEEQFYLFWPILWLGVDRFKRCPPWIALGLLAAGSFGLALFASHRYPAAAFYLLPTRAWELLLGCLLAVYSSRSSPRSTHWSHNARQTFAAVGALMIMLSFVFVGRNGGFPAPKGLLPTLGTVLIIAFASRDTVIGSLLAATPMVYVGRLSYSWYLAHWPAILFLRPLGIESPWIQGLVGLALGLVCHHWIERPTRTIPESRILTRILLPTLAIGVFAVALPHLGLRAAPGTQRPTFWCDCDLKPSTTSNASKPGCVESGLVGDVSTGLRRAQPIPGPLQAMILGDSHAKSWMPGLDAALGELGWNYAAFPAAAASPFFAPENPKSDRYGFSLHWPSDTRQEFDRHRRRFIASNAVPLVIVSARWFNYFRWTENEFERDFEELLRTFPTSQMLIIGQPPELPFASSGFSEGPIDIGLWTPFRERTTAREGRRLIHARILEITRRNPRVRFLETESQFLKDGVIRPFRDGQILYRDDDHVSLEGALLMTSTFKDALLQCIKPSPTPTP